VLPCRSHDGSCGRDGGHSEEQVEQAALDLLANTNLAGQATNPFS
jgi:hypothetical protein